MLRRAGKRREFVAAERDEDAARFLPDGAHRRAGIVTSIQRSPATAIHGGRRSATNGTPVCRAAAAAFAEMTVA